MESDVLGLPLMQINNMVGFDCNDQYLSYGQLIVDNIVFQFYEHIESIPYLVLWFVSSVFYRVALISCIYLLTDLYIFL